MRLSQHLPVLTGIGSIDPTSEGEFLKAFGGGSRPRYGRSTNRNLRRRVQTQFMRTLTLQGFFAMFS